MRTQYRGSRLIPFAAAKQITQPPKNTEQVDNEDVQKQPSHIEKGNKYSGNLAGLRASSTPGKRAYCPSSYQAQLRPWVYHRIKQEVTMLRSELSRRLCFVSILVLCLSACQHLTAQEHPLTTESENPQDYRSKSYRIHIGDVLQVTVYKHPELSRKVSVRGDGNYVLPAEAKKLQKPSAIDETIRDMHVAGLTAVSVANELREKLKPMIANPQVAITVFDTIMRPGPPSEKPSPQLRDTPPPAQTQNSPSS